MTVRPSAASLTGALAGADLASKAALKPGASTKGVSAAFCCCGGGGGAFSHRANTATSADSQSQQQICKGRLRSRSFDYPMSPAALWAGGWGRVEGGLGAPTPPASEDGWICIPLFSRSSCFSLVPLAMNKRPNKVKYESFI